MLFFPGELCVDFKATVTKVSTGVSQVTETTKQLLDKAVEVDQNLGLGLNMESLASALELGTNKPLLPIASQPEHLRNITITPKSLFSSDS